MNSRRLHWWLFRTATSVLYLASSVHPTLRIHALPKSERSARHRSAARADELLEHLPGGTCLEGGAPGVTVCNGAHAPSGHATESAHHLRAVVRGNVGQAGVL